MLQRGSTILAEARAMNIVRTSSRCADYLKFLAFWQLTYFSTILTYSKNIDVKAEKE